MLLTQQRQSKSQTSKILEAASKDHQHPQVLLLAPLSLSQYQLDFFKISTSNNSVELPLAKLLPQTQVLSLPNKPDPTQELSFTRISKLTLVLHTTRISSKTQESNSILTNTQRWWLPRRRLSLPIPSLTTKPWSKTQVLNTTSNKTPTPLAHWPLEPHIWSDHWSQGFYS